MAQIIKQIANLIQENHFEEAEAIINRMATERATDPAILCELGKLTFSMGKLEEAQNHLHASLALDQNNFEAYYQLGLILLKEAKYELAMPNFRQACEHKSNFALGHFYWGLTLYNMGNLRGALGQFKETYKIDQSLSVALYYSGLVNHRQNKYDEAKQDLEAMIALQPDFAPAHNALGITLFHLGKTEEAISSLEQACKLNPNFSLAHLNVGNILAQSGSLEQAIKHYDEALANADLSAAERGLGYNNLAVVFMKIGQWEKAFESLLQATAIAPHIVQAQINLGLIQILLQEYDLAINHFEQIIQNDSVRVEASCYCGIALLCLGKYDAAQSMLSQAYDWSAKDSLILENEIFYFQLLLWLSYAYIAGQNYQQAKLYLQQIMASEQKLDKHLLSLSLDAMGLCCALTDQHSEAIDYFAKALEIDPQFALALLHRARSYEALHESQLSTDDYLRAIQLDPTCMDADKDYISQLLISAKVEEALAQATRLLILEPKNTDARVLLAAALFRKNDYDKAKEIVSSITKESPNNVTAYTMLGQIYMAQGNYAHADEIFLSASKLSNVDAELFFFWATALNYLGFSELALEKYKQAADINPYNADIYESWGQTLKSLGRISEAGEVYKLASSYLDDITNI